MSKVNKGNFVNRSSIRGTKSNIGWSGSPGGVLLSPSPVKIQAFGHNVTNYNIYQTKYWYFARNQFSGSLYRRRFGRDIDSQRISCTLSSDP
jgi:hypothetical protein